MQIHSNRWEVHSRDSTQCKRDQESESPQRVGSVDQTTTVHCLQPVEDLDSGWNRDKHCRQHCDESQQWAHSRGEHVVAIDNESNDSNACEGEDH